ncbi:MAG: hypothetical protein K5912_04140 [Alphaproteobacteria bacterium]|nr:hypothetical protein [Alphaproteobacteria bacterium]
MKKIALTSMLSVFAVSGAYAANAIDGNPLYMPKAGAFYSETALSSHSEATENWTLGEEFGYGISDKLAVSVNATLAEASEPKPAGNDEAFDAYGLTDLGVKLTFRAFEKGGIVADVYGAYNAGDALIAHSTAADDTFWFDKDLVNNYTWTAGVRAGFTTGAFTIAGHAAFEYANTESFNWNDGDIMNHALILGIDGQYVIDSNWNLVAGVEYKGYTDEEADNSGTWTGTFGVNYNIDSTMYVGAYVNGVADHWKGDVTKLEKGWGARDGFGFGAKFGVQF